MGQTLFETRQRAEMLLKEAIAIWRQSDRAEPLEGIENDPVFSILLSALAYQFNETESEIARFRDDVLEEFARMMVPFESGHAVPASVVVKTMPVANIDECEFNDSVTCQLGGTDFRFLPLLNTRVLNAYVTSVGRIDGRRWSVKIKGMHPFKDISGISFALMASDFHDVKIFLNGKELPVVAPWQPASMPLSDAFSFDNMIFGKSQIYTPSELGMGAFTRHNVKIFTVKSHSATEFGYFGNTEINLVFEFVGIENAFTFTKEKIVLNANILVNAEVGSCTLSSASLYHRVSEGFLLNVINPLGEKLYGESKVVVRRVDSDRFNKGALVKLLNSLLCKFNSDFYAFLDIDVANKDAVVRSLREILYKMMDSTGKSEDTLYSGTYLVIKSDDFKNIGKYSMDVRYLYTRGEEVNAYLKQDSPIVMPATFDSEQTEQIAPPFAGKNEMSPNQNPVSQSALMFISSNNRIVTPADARIFCATELFSRYGVGQEMIKSITVEPEVDEDIFSGYHIAVRITLKQNQFIERGFSERIPFIETVLEKMLLVRSSGIYPMMVKISVE